MEELEARARVIERYEPLYPPMDESKGHFVRLLAILSRRRMGRELSTGVYGDDDYRMIQAPRHKPTLIMKKEFMYQPGATWRRMIQRFGCGARI